MSFLKLIGLLAPAILSSVFIMGQEPLRDSLPVPKQKIDANFIFSYYDQEGRHSAVTGGLGTEELTDRSGRIILTIPLDTARTLRVNFATNVYSSASTDLIDSRLSSASAQDFHTSLDIGWEKAHENHGGSWGWQAGGAIESDYLSLSAGGYYVLTSADLSRTFSGSATMFFDRWILYFPEELRGTVQTDVTTDKRQTFALQFQYDQVINRRMQASVGVEVVYQQGLLSTPFHRVFFRRDLNARIERFPGHRWKIPVSGRFHFFINDFWMSRLHYRYYQDDFGIRAHSFEIEMPLKLSPLLTFTPIYRYHTQQESRFFQPFGRHEAEANYYTSDFDLSGFHSHKFGVGLRYHPLLQLGQAGIEWDSVGMRLTRYERSDGLKAWSVTSLFDLKF